MGKPIHRPKMNNRHSSEPIRKRQGIFYYSPPSPEGFGEFYMHMFPEDVSLGIMPIGGRSSRPNFGVTLCPADEAVKDMITAGLNRRDYGYGRSLADSLYEFFHLLAADLCAAEQAIFEIVYLEDPQTKKMIGFELAFISENQIVEKRGQLYQFIPLELARERNVPEQIPLVREDLMVFKAPADFEKALRDVRQILAQLDKSRFPMMLLEATKRNVPYDFIAHERSMKLALVEAVKPIGWNARGTFNDCVLSYYWIHLSLTFEKFKIRLREAMLTTLNSGLERIGEKISFKAQIKIEGLPTLADIDTANKNLDSGAMPFTEVMKTFELR
jgi:hypothetical protein